MVAKGSGSRTPTPKATWENRRLENRAIFGYYGMHILSLPGRGEINEGWGHLKRLSGEMRWDVAEDLTCPAPGCVALDLSSDDGAKDSYETVSTLALWQKRWLNLPSDRSLLFCAARSPYLRRKPLSSLQAWAQTHRGSPGVKKPRAKGHSGSYILWGYPTAWRFPFRSCHFFICKMG